MSKVKKEEGSEFFRDIVVYREWGCWLASLERYALAIARLERAIKSAEGGDLRTLLGLYAAQTNHACYKDAAETSEKCMEINPDLHSVKHKRVEAFFNIEECGYGLVHAYQGLRGREMPFRYDIYQGRETVEDCVGRNTAPDALVLLYPWIQKLQEHRKALVEKLEEEEDEFEGIDEDQSKFKVNDEVVQHEANMNKLRRVIAKMYLGYMTRDKDFLHGIVQHSEKIDSTNKKSSMLLHELSVKCYKKLVHVEELLRARRPLYLMLFKRMLIPEGHKIRMEEEKQLRRNIIIIEADFLLRKLHYLRKNRDYSAFFKCVDRIKEKFDSYPSKIFTMKQRCLNTVYNMVAWVYIDTRDLRCLEDEETKRRYLKHHLGIHVAKLPRNSDLAWVPFINRKSALRIFRRRLAMASEPLELAWLFHEFCKYLIEIRRYDLARFYAKKARDMGHEARSEQWLLNANHLMLRVEIVQNNRNEAREAALLTFSNAKKLGIDYLVDFYKRAIEIVDDMEMERMIDVDSIAARQRLILDLMPENMRAEVDFLWRSMEVVPARRRLSVMPGCKPVDRKFKLPCRRKTILPNPPKDPAKEARIALLKQYRPSRKRPGFVNFEEFE
ncbi:hypothetical protein KM043_010313 [Ampulex compressa]|nr:hypothetical protein KM043_010313 [Ampulex compressa]